jgi:hypothetical protein
VSADGSDKPVAPVVASAAKPAACRPLVSTTSTGFVAPSHVTHISATIASSGSSVTKSWP